MNRKWTEEDSRWLRDNHTRMDPLAISVRLKVPLSEVERRVRDLKAAAAEAAASRNAPGSLKEAAREHSAARKEYEKGIELFNRRDLDHAARVFEAIVEGAPEDKTLLDRARMYLAACRNGKKPSGSSSVDDLFAAAVFEKNRGNPTRALELLRKADGDASDGRVPYLAACCHAMAGETDLAIQHLKKAIRLDRQNRVQARLDADLAVLRGTAAFSELLAES